jgi:hypothetical protein
MHRFLAVALCALGALAGSAYAQKSSIQPMRVDAGTILEFHLQTRLDSAAGNLVDALPKGALLQVKMLDSIDSTVSQDGAEFRGLLMSSMKSRGEVVVHSGAEVSGIFALLRSRRHPEGFRYELLLTGVKEHGKYYPLTASLSSAIGDSGSQSVVNSKAEAIQDSKETVPANRKLP